MRKGKQPRPAKHSGFAGLGQSSRRAVGILALLLVGTVWPAGADEGASPPAAPPPAGAQLKIGYENWAQDADLAITLDQHLYPALLATIRAYGARQQLKIAVREGTCGISAGALANQTVDLAGFCCPPSEADQTLGVDFHTIAIGAIAMYVHPENPIDNLSLAEARGVFAGTIRRWSELKSEDGKPGPPLAIQPIGRLHCQTRPGHWRALLDNEELFSPRLKTVGAIEDVFRQVAANPSGIGGFESLYMAREVYPTSPPLKPVKINGFDPSPENLLSGGYPLYFVFNLSSWQQDESKAALVGELISYLRQQAAEVDRKFGLVSANLLQEAGWQFQGNEVAKPL